MEAKELRIGNWVNIEAIDLQIDSIHSDNTIRLQSDDVNHKNYSSGSIGCFYINRVTPLPLTEEWLVKFGFKTDGVTYDLQFPFVFHYGYRFSLYNTGNAVDFKRSGWAVRVFQSKQNIEIGRIQYVHQLQNLYFALTNTELTII